MSSNSSESDMTKNFIKVFEHLFKFLDLDCKFVTEVPLSTLSNTLEFNYLVGVSGTMKGNIMFSFNKQIRNTLVRKIIGNIDINEGDIYLDTAIADFFVEFSKRVVAFMPDEKINVAAPIGVTGQTISAMISQVPSKNLFFKVQGERLAVAYFIEKG